MKPVVVTGATGFVGRALVRHLAEQGRPVRALVRPRSIHRAPRGGGIEVFEGDVLDAPSLARAVRGGGSIVHLAGVSSSADRQLNVRVHVEGTEHLRRAAESAGVARVVHVSSTCAGRVLRDSYGQTKLAGEGVWRGTSVATTVLRPTMIYGRGSAEFELFASVIARSPVVPIPGPGRALLRPVALPDVLQLVSRILDHGEAPIGTFDVAGPEPISVSDLIGLVARLQGRNVKVISIPQTLPILAARILGYILAVPPWNVDQVLAFLQDTLVDIEPARRVFGFDPRPLEEGLAEIFSSGA